MVPVDTGLDPPLSSSRLIEAIDSIVWVFGFDEIACFDGTRWSRFPRA